jgi:hypothetical protein
VPVPKAVPKAVPVPVPVPVPPAPARAPQRLSDWLNTVEAATYAQTIPAKWVRRDFGRLDSLKPGTMLGLILPPKDQVVLLVFEKLDGLVYLRTHKSPRLPLVTRASTFQDLASKGRLVDLSPPPMYKKLSEWLASEAVKAYAEPIPEESTVVVDADPRRVHRFATLWAVLPNGLGVRMQISGIEEPVVMLETTSRRGGAPLQMLVTQISTFNTRVREGKFRQTT